MAQFIENVVKDLVQNQPNFINTTLVLPGKRPMLFFKQEFQRQSKNIILPQMKSIEELMSELSDLEIISGINLWFKAYQADKKIVGFLFYGYFSSALEVSGWDSQAW